MRRSTLLLTLGVIFLSFGYTTQEDGDISKIYLINDLLIRTNPGSDISFYNIANPRAVTKLGTLTIEKNSDVAATGTTMYADRGRDLMVYDISNPAAPRAIDSIKRAFSSWNEPVFWNEGPDFFEGPFDNDGFDRVEDQMSVKNGESNGSSSRQSKDGGSVGGFSGCGGCFSDEAAVAPTAERGGGFANDASSGQAGSLARFIIVGSQLYCIDESQLKIYDISNPTRPRYVNAVDVRWGIETIFPEGDELYIGGREGMYIYSIANPVEPTYLGEFTHRRSCDPVVVDGDRAYVTLRGGSPCGGQSDQLDIIDVSNPRNPQLLKTVPMEGPYGLGAKDGIVMVCDGKAGLKSMRTSDLENITQCGGIEGVNAQDVIWYGDLLILTAEEGFWLYDATDPCNPTLYGRLEL